LLFSSSIFLFLFLPAALLGYQILSRFGRTAMLSWLSLISMFFYAYWNPLYLILLLVSIAMNHLFSLRLGENRSERLRGLWLSLAIVANLLLLIYFKYLFPLLNFFHAHGLIRRGFADVVLPLGISFFTFTQIAYLIDLRQGIARQQGILSYSVFVTFFPHLIAGPIIHPRELMPQLDEGRIRGLSVDDVALGMTWFVMGLAKKVLIADRIAPLADLLFAHPTAAGLATSWLGALAYAMQLYFDFSGYSDMALALAKMFSIDFPINFDSPFKAHGIIEFWQRWHMTLSRYLNEYLYTPTLRFMTSRRLSQGKKVTRKAAATPSGFFDMVFVPTMWTMGIAGIWHGAAPQFFLFGLLQGIYLVINHGWRYLTPKGSRFHDILPAPLLTVITFVAFLISLVFFRAANLQESFYILGGMFGFHGIGPTFLSNANLADLPTTAFFLRSLKGCVISLTVCFFIVWGLPNTQEILGQLPKEAKRFPSVLPHLRWRPNAAWSLGLAGVLCVVILMLDASTRFLYFQF
jgi:alginate O-acetyltransferase complex protein AlgI